MLLLAGCSGGDVGGGALSSEEIRREVVRNPMTRCGSILLGAWRYTAWHDRDGRVNAVVLAGTTREEAAGVWRVTADDLYCRTWNNTWAEGREGCFTVTKTADLLTFDHVSGAPGEADSYTYRLGESCD
ncbi:MAG: hypothetical protein ACMVO3_18060 [Thalassobaculum sp.]